MKNLVQLGSQTAKNGFKNEHFVANKFNNWETDTDAQMWLKIMQYNLSEISSVKATVLHGYKTDVHVQIKITFKDAIDTENIQVKLISNKSGFNQIDKRWLINYKKMWNIPDDVYTILQQFTGEIKPSKKTKDPRRMLFSEMQKSEQELILNWFTQNKTLILSDIIRGRGQFAAEWVLVIQNIDNNIKWTLKNINEVIQHYSCGDVIFSPKGSLYIGRITMQRKGGDAGRPTANMLQFKINPASLINEKNMAKI